MKVENIVFKLIITDFYVVKSLHIQRCFFGNKMSIVLSWRFFQIFYSFSLFFLGMIRWFWSFKMMGN